ncbi:MAG: hypothetical protein U0804_27725 [Gemmataceae bacterium]
MSNSLVRVAAEHEVVVQQVVVGPVQAQVLATTPEHAGSYPRRPANFFAATAAVSRSSSACVRHGVGVRHYRGEPHHLA